MLNLLILPHNLSGNRLLYIAAGGYCVAIASLLHAMLEGGPARRRWTSPPKVGILLLMLGSIAVCWVHLRPWHTATVLAESIEGQLATLVPAQPRPSGMVWYVENLPAEWKGAPLLYIGMGEAHSFATGDTIPSIQVVERAESAPLNSVEQDAFALRFRFVPELNRFRIDQAAGITSDAPPPSSPATSADTSGLSLWDFRECAPETLGSWQPAQTQFKCEQGKGLALDPSSGDPQLVSSNLNIEPLRSGVSFVRLRVSVLYPSEIAPGSAIQEWFWRGQGANWDGEHSSAMPIRGSSSGRASIYWTYIPTSQIEAGVTGLRFDPINTETPATIQWIALDLIPNP